MKNLSGDIISAESIPKFTVKNVTKIKEYNRTNILIESVEGIAFVIYDVHISSVKKYDGSNLNIFKVITHQEHKKK